MHSSNSNSNTAKNFTCIFHCPHVKKHVFAAFKPYQLYTMQKQQHHISTSHSTWMLNWTWCVLLDIARNLHTNTQSPCKALSEALVLEKKLLVSFHFDLASPSPTQSVLVRWATSEKRSLRVCPSSMWKKYFIPCVPSQTATIKSCVWWLKFFALSGFSFECRVLFLLHTRKKKRKKITPVKKYMVGRIIFYMGIFFLNYFFPWLLTEPWVFCVCALKLY